MKGKSQMSLFVGDMIECINNLQKFCQAIPTPDKHFQQKDLLYANDKRTEKEISQTTPLTLATSNLKYHGVILTK